MPPLVPDAALAEEVAALQKSLWAASARAEAAEQYAKERFSAEELQATQGGAEEDEAVLAEEVRLLSRLQDVEATAERRKTVRRWARPALAVLLLAAAGFVAHRGHAAKQAKHAAALEETVPKPWWYDTHDRAGAERSDESLDPLDGSHRKPFIGAVESKPGEKIPEHVRKALVNGTYTGKGFADGEITHVSQDGETFTKDTLTDGDTWRETKWNIGYGNSEVVRPWLRGSLMGRGDTDILSALDSKFDIKWKHCDLEAASKGYKPARLANKKWGKDLGRYICKRLRKQRKDLIFNKLGVQPPAPPLAPPFPPKGERMGAWGRRLLLLRGLHHSFM